MRPNLNAAETFSLGTNVICADETAVHILISDSEKLAHIVCFSLNVTQLLIPFQRNHVD